MRTMYRLTVAAAIGIASLSPIGSAHAGNGSAVGAGLVGFGVGAIVGSALAPQAVYVAPPPVYYAPAPPVYVNQPRLFMWGQSTTSGIPIDAANVKPDPASASVQCRAEI